MVELARNYDPEPQKRVPRLPEHDQLLALTADTDEAAVDIQWLMFHCSGILQ